MKEPDFDKLTEVNDELDELADTDKLTKDEFARLYKAAKDAVGDYPELLEGFLMRGREYGFEP